MVKVTRLAWSIDAVKTYCTHKVYEDVVCILLVLFYNKPFRR